MTSRRRPRLARLAIDVMREGTVTLSAEHAHYLRHVLRLEVGDELELFDAAGKTGRARLAALGRSEAVAFVEQVSEARRAACSLTVALATPKGERADWAVEKLTELGVEHIVWLACERSVVVPGSAGKRQERWARLAAAAAGQAARGAVPSIEGPVPFASFLDGGVGERFIASLGAEPLVQHVAAAPPRSATLLVGPEGGFSPAELAMARDAGYTAVALTPFVLRVETAALAGAAMLIGAGEAMHREQ